MRRPAASLVALVDGMPVIQTAISVARNRALRQHEPGSKDSLQVRIVVCTRYRIKPQEEHEMRLTLKEGTGAGTRRRKSGPLYRLVALAIIVSLLLTAS